MWKEKSQLEEDKQTLELQKAVFEKQRQKYVEAAHKLERDVSVSDIQISIFIIMMSCIRKETLKKKS